MAVPLARVLRISTKAEPAREAATAGIEGESKRTRAARLRPSASENIAAHRAGDGAVICLLPGVRAVYLISRARKPQRSIIGQIHARKISARRDCGSTRGGGTRLGHGYFEFVGLARAWRMDADCVVTHFFQHALPIGDVLGDWLDIVPLGDDSETKALCR